MRSHRLDRTERALNRYYQEQRRRINVRMDAAFQSGLLAVREGRFAGENGAYARVAELLNLAQERRRLGRRQCATD